MFKEWLNKLMVVKLIVNHWMLKYWLMDGQRANEPPRLSMRLTKLIIAQLALPRTRLVHLPLPQSELD